jgi:hypothetical protein
MPTDEKNVSLSVNREIPPAEGANLLVVGQGRAEVEYVPAPVSPLQEYIQDVERVLRTAILVLGDIGRKALHH